MVQLKLNIKTLDKPWSLWFVAVVNVLFLFWMMWFVYSYRSLEKGIVARLPKVLTSDSLVNKDFVIALTSENVLYFNGHISTLKEISKMLALGDLKKKSVLIRADRRSMMGRVVEVWDICRKLGIEEIYIVSFQN